MDSTVIVAICSLIGTALGSVVSVYTSNRLMTWRINELEKKVDKHNQVLDRVAVNEADMEALRQSIKEYKEKEEQDKAELKENISGIQNDIVELKDNVTHVNEKVIKVEGRVYNVESLVKTYHQN